MIRDRLLRLASEGLRSPIATDLVLREHADHDAILLDGRRLGEVIVETARRFDTPLAFPLMDLALEKRWLLERIGLGDADRDTFHFDAAPGDEAMTRLGAATTPTPRLAANAEAIRRVAADAPDLIPIGMSIGPFSLATKLLADPITPVYMAGSGATAAEDSEVALLERVMEMATRIVLDSVSLQCAAGARAVFIAEPAASVAFFSPMQLADGADAFERYAIAPNRRVRALLARYGADLLFHCCGELVTEMVRSFASLDPSLLSLGSSRRLWEDAALVPANVVLYGNLPTKRFYSDELTPPSDVPRMAEDLERRMRDVGHPFILGSECDVLSVPGAEQRIGCKLQSLVRPGRSRCGPVPRPITLETVS